MFNFSKVDFIGIIRNCMYKSKAYEWKLAYAFKRSYYFII